ncbi:unnamed protein product [Brassicogethes aeneus]|uniref:Uncharacterized protein n=1 Tax=Brassicogethes aeneus TaxID=1431903 RepID=A0A9P0FLC6_BRAAE|nr:unnamed protein product [Brassicogethes aeneus]
MSLRAQGQVQASKVLKNITINPQAFQKSLEPQQLILLAEDALAVLIDAKLSREQYDVIRRKAPEKFPSYKIVRAAKKLCYPTDISATETSASFKLQALLDHTTERLCQTLSHVIIQSFKELNKLCLISKWGFDGSSGNSTSKYFITMKQTRYCRPIKIEFKKESTCVSIAEYNKIEDEIKKLIDSNITIKSKQLKVNHKLICSMVDGKVCNALTETTSTMKCLICGATSKQFNQIDNIIAKEIKTEDSEPINFNLLFIRNNVMRRITAGFCFLLHGSIYNSGLNTCCIS